MKKIIIIVLMVLSVQLNAQKNEPVNATFIDKSISFQEIPSLASRAGTLELADLSPKEIKDGRYRDNRNDVIIGKGLPLGDDPLLNKAKSLELAPTRAFNFSFEAVSPGSSPSDPSGAVGPNHYLMVYNTGFRIFDKTGNPLTNELDASTIFPKDACCDLTCSYDNDADRFVMTILSATGAGNTTNTIQVAVSQTSDPVNGGWYLYNFPMETDYQKLSVWSDGYYLTANKDAFNNNEAVYALERAEMLSGNPNAQIIGFPLPGIATGGFYSPQAFNVTGGNMPAAGNVPIVYLQDDAWAGVNQDHLKLWTVNVDWTTPGNSVISAASTLNTAPFNSVFDGGSFQNLTQPNGGQDIDAIQATIMNQAQFRKFANHNSAVFNFVVDTDGTSGEKAGIRWYELRQTADGQPWSIYQEGTYTAPDNKHAWMASMAMDVLGNIGMGYTGMGGTTNQIVSTYFTGRHANDALGTMTITETAISLGNQNINSFSGRYGDYSKIDVDPSDNKTFWFINEINKSGTKDVVGIFKIAPDLADDVAVVSIDSPISSTLTNSETVTITIFNYGQNDASNFPVAYQIDGGAWITETYTGTIASSTSAQYTFYTTANLSVVGQTYVITAQTDMAGDLDNTNDASTVNVTNLNPNDIGVTAIVSPVSGTSLTTSESVIVTITNFGGASQSNFNVSYTLNGNTVTEQVAGPLAVGANINYTFTQTADFSAIGDYNLSVTTLLSGDVDDTNDAMSVIITKQNCQPISDCSLGDGLRGFQLGTIDNSSDCGADGYSDFTNLITDLNQDSSNDLTLTTNYGNQFVRVWIDFNDDFTYTTDEIVVDNFELAIGQADGTFTETTTLDIPANAPIGEHLLRAKTHWDNVNSADACEDVNYGETEDYKVNILGTASTNNDLFKQDMFIIQSKGDNQFSIVAKTDQFTDRINLTVSNVLGQTLLSRSLDYKNGGYEYHLDLSYATSGVYFVNLNYSNLSSSKKLIK